MDVGNFYRCRLQIPQNFGSVILANLPTRVPLCLLNNAKAPVGMTDFKIKRIFWGIGNFYRCRLQILANLSGKHFGWNGTLLCRFVLDCADLLFVCPPKNVRTEKKNSLKAKFFGQEDIAGTSGTQTLGHPGQNFMQVAFFCCFRQGMAGMSRHLGRDVPDLEKLYARKLWADFSFTKLMLGVSRWSLFWKLDGGLLVPISAYLCPLGVAILRY